MENSKGSSDAEDIPSDFFDDFAKEEFMEGLSVIDSWNDEEKVPRTTRVRINTETVENVRDLRELIAREANVEKKYAKYQWKRHRQSPYCKNSSDQRRSDSESRLDDYIKPGSRRDPNKTNEAIKKDKEKKVKEHLAKHLDSTDDLRPPGTELDDFFEGKKSETRKRISEANSSIISPPKERRVSPIKYRRESPLRRREFSPKYRHTRYRHFSPYRSPRHSPRYSSRHFSPTRNYRRLIRSSPHRPSLVLRRRQSRSPIKRSYRRSPSRSPTFARDKHQHSLSPSPTHRSQRDDFLYPKKYYQSHEFSSSKDVMQYQQLQPTPQFNEPMIAEYPGGVSAFSYTQQVDYNAYTAPYEYGMQAAPSIVMPTPLPAPAPIPTPIVPVPIDVNNGPVIVPASQQIISPLSMNKPYTTYLPDTIEKPPEDALAKLVADGKLSHADYLKLTPNKGVPHVMDTNTKAAVLSRCEVAISRLGNMMLPNKLLINNMLVNAGPDLKQLAPKFCSPLKRQSVMEFHFTKANASTIVEQNKEIVETVIKKLCLEGIVEKTKRKMRKNMKDAAVQTTKPFCCICEINESKKFIDTGTSIDRDHISSTVHTQVVEQDLISSKTLFNPSGSIADDAPISIAHMTPAQLVSQLAARAKTLKKPDHMPSSNQYRKPHNFKYDGRGGSSNQYHGNNYNYRF